MGYQTIRIVTSMKLCLTKSDRRGGTSTFKEGGHTNALEEEGGRPPRRMKVGPFFVLFHINLLVGRRTSSANARS